MNIALFIKNSFILVEKYFFNKKYSSYIFKYGDFYIIVDECFDIEKDSKNIFDYSKYCEMQNKYMLSSKCLLRFNYDDDEISLINQIISLIKHPEEKPNDFVDEGGNFSNIHIDNTPTESSFEDIFINAYGNETLECLRKEVSISYEGDKNYFIDYVIETKSGNFAFEENGVNYHHPLIVGKEKYKNLLNKQNAIMLLGYKVYRFSSENLTFKDKVVEELRTFLPDKTEFIPKIIFKNNRGIELYRHQTDILNQLDNDRLNGKTTSLIVIPTAAGKSEICITDLEKE